MSAEHSCPVAELAKDMDSLRTPGLERVTDEELDHVDGMVRSVSCKRCSQIQPTGSKPEV